MLERRVLLTGTWAPLAHKLPNGDGAQTMIQLSDGTIMAQGGFDSPSVNWYRLTPVQGSYVNGNWTALAPMHVGRLFYASVMLNTGKVLVLGGEVATDRSETSSAEIYDPSGNSWSTNTASFPEANFGDGMAETLSDGRVLAAAEGSSNCYIYDPFYNTWSAAIPSLNGDAFSEEGWVKLPGGT
ncbi:MAG TPA: hypothetical protein VLI90_12720, partial [Tepidisphaeraceae bacterium]|nr:hypothetical protein [Tepidisphaeraceae bacterium]